MPGPHKHPPMSLRLPEGLSAWLAAEVARTGKRPHRIVIEILERGAAVTPPEVAPPAKPAPRARQAAAAPVAAKSPRARKPKAGECGHGYPDVKITAGVRVCRKCG